MGPNISEKFVPGETNFRGVQIKRDSPISPPSSAGNRYILKFAWAHALPTKEAVGVVAALRQVRSHFVHIEGLCI